jgi:GDP/UDP-N,N'-diacetylbacillosamine 2-epimerase (hydrolysing)
MRIGVLTSSRADYGIYHPLLIKMRDDGFFDLQIIAFGSHLSHSHGFTIEEIEADGFATIHRISCLLTNDDEQSIATAYGLTALKFADFWARTRYDVVLCLGDRFEMNAAVMAGIPFQVKFAHFHGGETTLGAIDNVYRHQITLASTLHFTASQEFCERVNSVTGGSNNIYNVGSLSLSDIKSFRPIKAEALLGRFGILNEHFVLMTFHPETLSSQEKNLYFAQELGKAITHIAASHYVVVTMPNADTQGSVFRAELLRVASQLPNDMVLVENFGKQNYFSAMHYCAVMVGNTSSAIIEAASFGKYAVNVGKRQSGRLQSENILNATFESNSIVAETFAALARGTYLGENVYFKVNVLDTVVTTLKAYYEGI